VTATSRKQVRDGLMAVLDYKPNREFRTTLDLYYSQFDQKEIMRGMMWNSHQWSASPTAIRRSRPSAAPAC
jgi:iron complex outermembrane receptor protein